MGAGFGEDSSQVRSELLGYTRQLLDQTQAGPERAVLQGYITLWEQGTPKALRPSTPPSKGARAALISLGTPLLPLTAVKGENAEATQLVAPAPAPPTAREPARPNVGLGGLAASKLTPNVAQFFENRGDYSGDHLVRPPGLPDRHFAAGAGEETHLGPQISQLVDEMRGGSTARLEQQDRMIHALEGIRKSAEDEKAHTKGTLASIRRSEELDVFLARGCDTLTVEVCGTLLGKDLFNGLKRACEHAKHLMQQVRWPTTVSNRICYGVASLSWGGKDHRALPAWSLSAADFPFCKAEVFDAYTMPAESKLEARPRHPVVFSAWKRQAENSIRVFECTYGLEHGPERR